MSNSGGRRLGYLVSRYPAISHSFILREVRGLRELGFEIEVASINGVDRPEEELTREEREEMARTFYVRQAGWRGAIAAGVASLRRSPRGVWRGLRRAWGPGRGHGVFYFAEALMIEDWMRRQGLGHLHVHFATPAATVGMVAAAIGGHTWSLTVHGPDEFDEVSRHRLREKLLAAEFVVCISSYTRSQLMRISPAGLWPRFEIGRLGVDTDRFAPRRRGRATSEENRAVEILCVGRLVSAKGQRILVGAIGRLVDEGRDVRLRLIGDGPERAGLESAAAKRGLAGRVTFAGMIDQDRIGEYFERADIFALASLAEGIPVVLMEAMAMGIPCVTTRVAGIPELIDSWEDGVMVAPGEEPELAQALGRLIDDRELRERMGQAARQRIDREYRLDKSLTRLAGIFTERLRNAKTPHPPASPRQPIIR